MLAALLAPLLVHGGVAAQTADPTQPPPGLMPRAEGEPEPGPPPGPELQSVLVSREPGGRRVAVISGEMVRQGSRWQGALVEKVGENEVVLRRGKARQVLRLYPKPAAAATRTEQQ
ncbi:MSHA biogenesis protein MshK [Pseudoduganella flava]|nr:MSHA biogenesis protein MshK [Pseudoduganella flava]